MKINRIHIKNRRGEQHHQGCGKTVHHPVCLKPAASPSGKGAGCPALPPQQGRYASYRNWSGLPR